MAVVVVAFIGTKAVDAESTTGWNTGSLDNDIFVENAGAIGAKVSASTQDFYDLSVTGSPYDFSSGGGNEGEHIFAWFNTLTPASLHAIIVVDDIIVDQIGCWNVGPPAGYTGGFINYVISPAAAFSTVIQGTWTTGGNPSQLSGVDGFGGRHTTSTSIMGNFNNALMDAISVGLGYRITRGDGASADATFANIVTFERTTANRYGALRAQSGVMFPLCKLIIGDTTANSHQFTDSNFTVKWPDEPASATFYELSAEEGSGSTTVTLSNGTLGVETTAQAALPFFDFTGLVNGGWSLSNVNLEGARAIQVDDGTTVTGGTWSSCGQISITAGDTPSITSVTILNPTNDGALLVRGEAELDDFVDITFNGAGIGGTSADSAIEVDITGAGPFAIDLDNFQFINRVAGSVDIHILANGNADYTFNIQNGGATPTYTNDGTGSVTIVNARPVRVTVTEQDGTPIQNAQVLLKAGDSAGAGLPYKASVTLSVTSNVVTVTHTAHGLVTGNKVAIETLATDKPAVRGNKTITVTGVNAYTYAATTSNGVPTGTFTATSVVLAGLTNVSGVVEDLAFSYVVDQPVEGWARKATSPPYFGESPLSGTIVDAGGYTATAGLPSDE